MKKRKLLTKRVAHFSENLEKFKSGNLSEEEFCKLLLDEITYLKTNVISRYKKELEEDKQQIKILSSIKFKISNNIQLLPEEKEVVLAIIG